MKLLISVFLLIVTIQANTIKPYYSIEASGNVIDIVIVDDMLAVSTDRGTIEAYSITSKEQIMLNQFPMIKDFMGDDIYPKVFSTDYLKLTKEYLAVVQGVSGSRELFIIKDNKKTRLISEKEKLFISKAKFVDDNHIMVALLSNEYILFDIKKRKKIYSKHISYSHFSDFMLSVDKKTLVGSSESGEITVLNVKDGTIIKTLKGANVDNVYKVDIKNSKVLAAGQDRRGTVYDLGTGSYSRFDSNFLIYAGALSPSARLAAFAFTEDNDIVIFDILLNKRLYTLKGQKSTLNSIVFIDEENLVSGSDDKFIMMWKLK
ncbi:MAG: WD40 repeat domain-containing protein [Sulfurospirillum sp.]|nr:WD40 repeat domain-containing protein [Sulfurospirillum sp.]MBL0703336.1 WD40 repeat domain-containing protein [Sulfurospirillum sp.]